MYHLGVAGPCSVLHPMASGLRLCYLHLPPHSPWARVGVCAPRAGVYSPGMGVRALGMGVKALGTGGCG